MKRVIAMILSLLLLASVALAEENDLASMSLDDLLALRQNVESEINARLASDSSSIYPGVYYVGKHIKEGSYVITNTGSESMFVFIFASEDDYKAHKANFDWCPSAGEFVYVTLETGMILMITDGIGQVQAAGKMSWAP